VEVPKEVATEARTNEADYREAVPSSVVVHNSVDVDSPYNAVGVILPELDEAAVEQQLPRIAIFGFISSSTCAIKNSFQLVYSCSRRNAARKMPMPFPTWTTAQLLRRVQYI
jgi:hypothetical protein